MKRISLLLAAVAWSLVGVANAAQDCGEPRASGPRLDARALGAKGDGIADDTQAIQSAVDHAASSGGTVFVPAGTYMIDAVRGVRLASGVTLRLSKGAKLQAIPNDQGSYSIIKIINVRDVNVLGGALLGERDQHRNDKGEWGMGITISASQHVVIADVAVTNMWGDGIYINQKSQDVTLCSVNADLNRRQGLSVISVDGLQIKHSSFSRTHGTNPGAGIDLEPNAGDSINNVRIQSSRFANNAGPGIQITGAFSPVSNVVVEDNEITSNSGPGVYVYGTSGHHVLRNVLRGNRGPAILLSKGSKSNTVGGNDVTGNGIRDEGENSVSVIGPAGRN